MKTMTVILVILCLVSLIPEAEAGVICPEQRWKCLIKRDRKEKSQESDVTGSLAEEDRKGKGFGFPGVQKYRRCCSHSFQGGCCQGCMCEQFIMTEPSEGFQRMLEKLEKADTRYGKSKNNDNDDARKKNNDHKEELLDTDDSIDADKNDKSGADIKKNGGRGTLIQFGGLCVGCYGGCLQCLPAGCRLFQDEKDMSQAMDDRNTRQGRTHGCLRCLAGYEGCVPLRKRRNNHDNQDEDESDLVKIKDGENDNESMRQFEKSNFANRRESKDFGFRYVHGVYTKCIPGGTCAMACENFRRKKSDNDNNKVEDKQERRDSKDFGFRYVHGVYTKCIPGGTCAMACENFRRKKSDDNIEEDGRESKDFGFRYVDGIYTKCIPGRTCAMACENFRRKKSNENNNKEGESIEIFNFMTTLMPEDFEKLCEQLKKETTMKEKQQVEDLDQGKKKIETELHHEPDLDEEKKAKEGSTFNENLTEEDLDEGKVRVQDEKNLDHDREDRSANTVTQRPTPPPAPMPTPCPALCKKRRRKRSAGEEFNEKNSLRHEKKKKFLKSRLGRYLGLPRITEERTWPKHLRRSSLGLKLLPPPRYAKSVTVSVEAPAKVVAIYKGRLGLDKAKIRLSAGESFTFEEREEQYRGGFFIQPITEIYGMLGELDFHQKIGLIAKGVENNISFRLQEVEGLVVVRNVKQNPE